jgi:predicted dehydrogenase
MGRKIYSVEVRACSYLPDWRPGRDYRKCSSARRSDGGGVLRDLSHDLDYLLWIAGEWTSLSAVGGKLSQLEIETEDAVIITGSSERAAMFCVSLNYVDRQEERWIIVNTDEGTLRADLKTGKFLASGIPVDLETPTMDELYCRQHKDAASKNPKICCNFAEGNALLQLISGVELAISSKMWVHR